MEPSNDPRFQKGLDRYNKASIGGALLGAPVAVLAWLGASEGVMLAYLVVAIVVLTAVLLRRRFLA